MGSVKYPALQDRGVLIELVEDFGTAKRIAEHLGCGRSTVRHALERFGVKPQIFVAGEEVKRILEVEE